jgi:predicted O-methyltransferase YrrM
MAKTPWIEEPHVKTLLERLYADAAKNDPAALQAARDAGVSSDSPREFFRAVKTAYLPVGPEFGKLLYTLVRTKQAKTVVEFGTSLGISTIYLAAALRDNGGGRLVTTEYEAEKAERAKKHLAEAGLVELVDIRVGDAMETLRKEPVGGIDLVLLDGAKGMYVDVLKLLEPTLHAGAIVTADNTDFAGLEGFLEYVRRPGGGYVTSAILTGQGRTSGHEVALRV